VLADHRELCRLLTGLQGCFAEADEGCQEACRRLPGLLKDFYSYLAAHFSEEEAGGLLEEAVCRLPRLSKEAMTLERQHAPLLEELKRIVCCVEKSDDLMEKDVSARFREFVNELRQHERAENHLAAEAFQGEPCENGNSATSDGAITSATNTVSS
jgi:hemerythrin